MLEFKVPFFILQSFLLRYCRSPPHVLMVGWIVGRHATPLLQTPQAYGHKQRSRYLRIIIDLTF